jgi:pimeloyl-ACP methyl ester carboxylesterase
VRCSVSVTATFGLVHGVCAGGWCWDDLTPYLKAAGHDVVSVDLPCEDPSATFSDYADVAIDAWNAVDDDLVVVGHSLAGLTIPLIAARRPTRELVFLCALIPEPGKSLIDQGFDWRAGDPSEWQISNDDGSFSIRPEVFGTQFAQDVEPALLPEMIGQLCRQSRTPFVSPCPLQTLPKLPCRYVLCREDRIVSPDWSRRAARAQLGVDPIELPGSHCPMTSRPAELADVLVSTALPA